MMMMTFLMSNLITNNIFSEDSGIMKMVIVMNVCLNFIIMNCYTYLSKIVK